MLILGLDVSYEDELPVHEFVRGICERISISHSTYTFSSKDQLLAAATEGTEQLPGVFLPVFIDAKFGADSIRSWESVILPIGKILDTIGKSRLDCVEDSLCPDVHGPSIGVFFGKSGVSQRTVSQAFKRNFDLIFLVSPNEDCSELEYISYLIALLSKMSNEALFDMLLTISSMKRFKSTLLKCHRYAVRKSSAAVGFFVSDFAREMDDESPSPIEFRS